MDIEPSSCFYIYNATNNSVLFVFSVSSVIRERREIEYLLREEAAERGEDIQQQGAGHAP